MRYFRHTIVICFALLASNCFSQDAENAKADSTGLPGDHFSLHGALDLFKQSASLEEFEKKLNDESNNVNNLDLNGDGDIDYIRVEDKMKDDAHAIVLQVPVSETESQDVAVIEIEKDGADNAKLQIVGDEDLYGDNKIVEPFDEEIKEVKGKKGPCMTELRSMGVWVNVWFWPCVKFVYAPAYLVWASPWYWHHYPFWWKPWKPHPWGWFHAHYWHYCSHYHWVGMHRTMAAHGVYAPHRRTSVIVVNRHAAARNAYKMNHPGKMNGPMKGPGPMKSPGGKMHGGGMKMGGMKGGKMKGGGGMRGGRK